MGLKVQIDGQKVGLNAPVRPPVTFIRGVKKRLSRGVTFINGHKITLWGTRGLRMEYIPYPNSSSYSTSQVFYVSRNMAYIAKCATGLSDVGYVQKLNISNPAVPVMDYRVKWADSITYSASDSSPTQSIYYSTVQSDRTYTGHKIVIENDIASISESSSSYTFTSNSGGSAVYIGGWLMDNLVLRSAGTVTQRTIDTYYNGTKQYSGNGPASSLTKYNNSQALISYYGKMETCTATARTTFSTRPQTVTNFLIDETNVLVCDYLGVSLMDATGADVWRYQFAQQDKAAFIIGKIGDYYVIYDNTQVTILKASDGEEYIKQAAPTTFKSDYTLPHISATGYLGIGDTNNGFYRISIV